LSVFIGFISHSDTAHKVYDKHHSRDIQMVKKVTNIRERKFEQFFRGMFALNAFSLLSKGLDF